MLSYLHADGLGSVVKTTNSAGTVTATRRYDAFGNLELGATNGYAFTGREWDGEAGLYYYRARYYDPKIGRFISEDPSWIWSWPNAYAYVENNPTGFTDPMGLMKVKNGVALPTGPLLINLKCLEECLGTDVELRLTSTTGGRHRGPEHGAGVAADFTVIPRDPFMDPTPRDPQRISAPVRIKDVLCCARACSFAYSTWHGQAGGLVTAVHFHSQIPPWTTGVRNPVTKPTQKDCCTP